MTFPSPVALLSLVSSSDWLGVHLIPLYTPLMKHRIALVPVWTLKGHHSCQNGFKGDTIKSVNRSPTQHSALGWAEHICQGWRCLWKGV